MRICRLRRCAYRRRGLTKINAMKREDVETDLVFGGFLVFNCPLKSDAASTIRMLNESSHRVTPQLSGKLIQCVMITGDNPLTAVHVAREVEIVDRDVLILDVPENPAKGPPLDATANADLRWQSVDEKLNISYSAGTPIDPALFAQYDICLTGPALSKFDPEKDKEIIFNLLSHTWVYARVSPSQKEYILNCLKEAGFTTLMCGDGTNDVGALKQAHVGVALLNGSAEDLKRIAEHQRVTQFKAMYEKQVALMAKWAPNGKPMPVPLPIAHLYPPGPSNPHRAKALAARGEKEDVTNGITAATSQTTIVATENQSRKRKKTPEELAAGLSDQMFGSLLQADDAEPPTIKLGDASVAAPFTSKLSNVVAIANIVRQGRCTLVAMIQMYKILALNCLISAYSLSVLYLKGIKFGDGQATISGMLMSVCFLGISRARVCRCFTLLM
jgi:manganese-transporting P-type ATPase